MPQSNAMRVEKLSQFLSRKLEEDPARVQEALQEMLDRNKRDPRTMPALLDKMATQPELRGFAQKLNAIVPPEQRGSAEVLTANQRGSARSVALDGVTPPTGAAHAPANTPEVRKATQQGQEKAKDVEQGD